MRRGLVQREAVDAETLGSLSDLRAAVYNHGEVPGRPKVAMSKLPEADAASDACLAESGYADAEGAARVDAENAFVRNHKSKLDQLKYQR